ncbi:metallophosphoesterase [Rhodoferax saidenbachensis]|uniref:Phosphodiesterase n=1 Tax=Rhodoferax saidenbachensis TaxID=1484693 RepID=A0ABU1ZQK7_9BURK|nr:metallophosphoesterase [Rhodoferax saidenbachensis]MDR7306811.1 putative phosphodiesterase [Rhodoferax saidenbachensis]
MVKLVILSDLHLDLKPMALEHEGQRIGTNADLVILAGDIAEGHRGLRWARESFPDKPIIYVAGNHEFYGRHWGGHLREMREKAVALDIAFLEDKVFEFGGLRFLGCSLWTDFELHGTEAKSMAMREAQEHLNDYARIKISKPKWRPPDSDETNPSLLPPEFTVRRFQESVAWLEQELANGDRLHQLPAFRKALERLRDQLLSEKIKLRSVSIEAQEIIDRVDHLITAEDVLRKGEAPQLRLDQGPWGTVRQLWPFGKR